MEKQGAHFFGITISEAQAEAGVVVHVSSAAQSKFKVHNKIMHSKFAACCLQLLLGSWLFRVVHDTEYGSVFTFQNSGGFWLLFKVSIRFNQRFASQERFLIEVSKIQNDSSKGIITQELPRAFQSPL